MKILSRYYLFFLSRFKKTCINSICKFLLGSISCLFIKDKKYFFYLFLRKIDFVFGQSWSWKISITSFFFFFWKWTGFVHKLFKKFALSSLAKLFIATLTPSFSFLRFEFIRSTLETIVISDPLKGFYFDLFGFLLF